jgi:signal transduction histidine kinase
VQNVPKKKGATESYAEVERLRAEAEATAKRFHDLVDGLDAVIWEADPVSLRFTFVSSRAQHLLRHPVEQWLASDTFWIDHLHPDDRMLTGAVRRAAVVDGRDHELEYRMMAADGRTVWVHDTGRVVLDSHGHASLLRGVMIDATARKRAEETTAALLEIVKDITGSLWIEPILESVQRRTAAILPCDRVATYYWDASANRFRDISRVGLPANLVPAAIALTFQPGEPIVDRLASGETVVLNDIRHQSVLPPDLLMGFGISALVAVPLALRGRLLGAYVGINAERNRRFDDDQVRLLESIARHVGVAIETTSLYRGQQEEAQISAALARIGQEMISSLDAPILLDRLCQLTTEVLECELSHTMLWQPAEKAYVPVSGFGYADEQWEVLRLLRLPRGTFDDLLKQLEQHGVQQVRTTDLADPGWKALAEALGMTVGLGMALRRGSEPIGFHSACRRHSERLFTPVHERIARGMAQLASLALENARLVEELGRASRVKSDFVATMSHELRTPLNAIVGYNSLMLDKAFGDLTAEQMQVLRRVDKSASELLELINATLDVSRLEAGRLPLDVRDVSLKELIAEVDAETRDLREKPGLSFAWQLPQHLPRLRTDPLKLKVILKNLIGNAVKFTEQGSVVVGVRRVSSKVEFSVADTGIGVEPSARKVIFEPFRQADSSDTRRYGGVGLGLYVARRLAESLGGDISLESAVGRGSTFRVFVPTGQK